MEKHAACVAALPVQARGAVRDAGEAPELRGACWLFSTVGVLEASYRKQGAEKGYLGAHEYLKLSEQAYGAVMARVCKENPACETGDADETWMGNTTEGGEAEWLYYLQKTVATTAAVPYSVCPYTQPPTPDTECAGAAAAAAKSPLEFTIPHAATLYDLPAIKRALHATDRPLAMALALFGQTYHFPCTKATAPYLQCDPDAAPPACAPCLLAPNFAGVKCCVEQSRFGSNMRGEVTPNRPGEGLVASGGHAVVVVGYSDAYVDGEPARPRRADHQELVVGRRAARRHVVPRHDGAVRGGARLAPDRLVHGTRLGHRRARRLPERPLARLVVPMRRPQDVQRAGDGDVRARDAQGAPPRVPRRRVAVRPRRLQRGRALLPEVGDRLGRRPLEGVPDPRRRRRRALPARCGSRISRCSSLR